MNINMDELGDRMTTHEVDIVLSCEIEKIDCDKCNYNNNFVLCHTCIENKNLTSNFEPKQNELDNLFIGAPVMVRDASFDEDEKYTLKICGNDSFITNDTDCLEFRLPTIEESPRNVWLAPHLEMPSGVENLVIHVRYPGLKIAVYNERLVKWSNVEAFMILEDFKK